VSIADTLHHTVTFTLTFNIWSVSAVAWSRSVPEPDLSKIKQSAAELSYSNLKIENLGPSAILDLTGNEFS